MNKQGKRTPEALALRRDAGILLKTLRKNAGLTQRDVALSLDMRYYTMVAQMEAGTSRIPPDSYVTYADCLGVDRKKFVQKLMQYYDPHTYRALWGGTRLTISELMK